MAAHDWSWWALFIAQVLGALGAVVVPLVAVFCAHGLGRKQAQEETRKERARNQKRDQVRELEQLATDLYSFCSLTGSSAEVDRVALAELGGRVQRGMFVLPDEPKQKLASIIAKLTMGATSGHSAWSDEGIMEALNLRLEVLSLHSAAQAELKALGD